MTAFRISAVADKWSVHVLTRGRVGGAKALVCSSIYYVSPTFAHVQNSYLLPSSNDLALEGRYGLKHTHTPPKGTKLAVQYVLLSHTPSEDSGSGVLDNIKQ